MGNREEGSGLKRLGEKDLASYARLIARLKKKYGLSDKFWVDLQTGEVEDLTAAPETEFVPGFGATGADFGAKMRANADAMRKRFMAHADKIRADAMRKAEEAQAKAMEEMEVKEVLSDAGMNVGDYSSKMGARIVRGPRKGSKGSRKKYRRH